MAPIFQRAQQGWGWILDDGNCESMLCVLLNGGVLMICQAVIDNNLYLHCRNHSL